MQAYLGEGSATSIELQMQRLGGQSGSTARRVGAQNVDRSSKLYEACLDFEALFIKQMLSAMRKSVQKAGLLDGGMAEDIYEDMLYDEYADSMAKNAGFGLADSVYLELTSLQQAALTGGDLAR